MCWSMPHMIHVVVAALCLIVFVVAAAFCEYQQAQQHT